MVCSDSSSQPIYEEMEFLHCKDHSQCFEIIPVYFWSGERVDLPCHMCELSMAYNGKVKYWAKAENMVEFLKEPQAGLPGTPKGQDENVVQYGTHPWWQRQDAASGAASTSSSSKGRETVYNSGESQFTRGVFLLR